MLYKNINKHKLTQLRHTFQNKTKHTHLTINCYTKLTLHTKHKIKSHTKNNFTIFEQTFIIQLNFSNIIIILPEFFFLSISIYKYIFNIVYSPAD